MSVFYKIIIVDTGQSIRFSVFLRKIEWIGMVLGILNLDGNQNCMIGSKVRTVVTTFIVNDRLVVYFFLSGTSRQLGSQ